MRNVFILYSRYLTEDGKDMTIGGIQTYIKALCNIIKKNGMKPIVMQFSQVGFKKQVNGIDVIGLKINNDWSVDKKSKKLLNKCIELSDQYNDIIILGTHSMGVRNNLKNLIGIQHGIAFDRRNYDRDSKWKETIYSVQRILKCINMIIKAKRFSYLVAVDYNYLNWARTMPGFKKDYVRVIPNFVKCEEFDKGKNNEIRIIFARRFEKHRGTRLFSSVVLKLLKNSNNINITFAGNGPDERYLKDLFKNLEQVKFIEYDSSVSVDIHKAYDIAVIPTIGSEGTSLSLLEAMAAKCSVVATNVGGMTNIVLDNFNGLLVDPDENELYKAIDKLINDEQLRKRLADNAYISVSQAFNYDVWEKKWLQVISNVTNRL